MGHGIMCKDMVPFKVACIFEGQIFMEDDQRLVLLFEPEGWFEEYLEGDKIPDDTDVSDQEHPVILGWRLNDAAGTFGKKQRMFSPEWVKDDHKVWLLNESQYNNVGKYEISLCANDEASILAFLKDFVAMFKPRCGIEPNEPVVMWG